MLVRNEFGLAARHDLEANYTRHPILGMSIWVICCYVALFISALPLAVSSGGAILQVKRLLFVVALVLLFFSWENNRKYKGVYLFILWVFLSSIINETDLGTTFSNFYPIISCIVFVVYLLEKEGSRAFIGITLILVIMLILQFVSVYYGFSGITDQGVKSYFFGTRVRISDVLIPFLGVSLLAIVYSRFKGWLIVTVAIAVSGALYFIAYEEVMTAFSAVVIFVLTILLSKVTRYRGLQRGLAIVALCFCAAFVLSEEVRSVFGWVLEGVLGKDMSLNGRTLLWSQGVSAMEGIHWLIGNGYASGYLFTLPSGFVAESAHSEYVNMLFRFGLIGMGFLVYFNVIQIITATRINNTSVRAIVIAAALAIAFTGISSTLYVNSYVFIWICVCLVLPSIEDCSLSEGVKL